LQQKLTAMIGGFDRYDLHVDQVRFSFRSGWIPVLGVKIDRFNIREKACRIRRLSGQDLLLQVDPWSLLQPPIRLGQVEVEYLEVSAPHDCKTQAPLLGQTVLGSPVKRQAPADDPRNQARELSEQWAQGMTLLFVEHERQQLKSPFRRLDINKLQVSYQDKWGRSWSLGGQLSGQLNQTLLANLSIETLRYAEQDLALLRGDWSVLVDSESAQLKGEVSVREGDVVTVVRIANNKSFDTEIRGDFRRVPLSAVTKVLQADVDFRYLWANCELSAQAPLSKILHTNLSMGNCQVDGPYGEILVKDVAASLSRLKRMRLEINQLILDQVLLNRRSLALSGVFANYGVLSAKWQLNEQGDWTGEGWLDSSEFLFSQNNLRDIQKVKKLPFAISSENHDWQVKIGPLELVDGEFEGDVTVQQTKDGVIAGRIAIHKLSLNPKIYQLILNSQPADLRVYGKFSKGESDPLSWSGIVATEQLHSDYYDLKNLKVKASNDASDKAHLKVTVGEGWVASKGPLVEWLQPTVLDATWSESPVNFSELSVRLQVNSDRHLRWRRGYVRLANGWQLSTEGEQTAQRRVSGWLQWDRPDRKYLQWRYQGSFFAGRWSPQTPWVKTWLNAHPEFLQDNKEVAFKAKNLGGLTEKINQAGQKAIEKVKEVLKPEKEAVPN
jgi:hypothetical protein